MHIAMQWWAFANLSLANSLDIDSLQRTNNTAIPEHVLYLLDGRLLIFANKSELIKVGITSGEILCKSCR